MMKKLFLPALFAPALLVAQETPYLFPGTSASESAVCRDTVGISQPGSGMSVVPMVKGMGTPVDTLDIGDTSIQVVLKDDNTWYYIKNMDKVSRNEVFSEYWDTEEINSYRKFPLDSLPYRTVICLVDSVSGWTCPNQAKVYSKFGYRRGRNHSGVDLPYPKGTPAKAAFDGKVRFAAYTRGYGNLVVIRHENGLETYYGHLSRLDVKAGDWVRSGDVVGLGGSTGRSTGSHLHFETRYKGFAFDPQWIADFESGKLRKTVFVLRRSYLSSSSHYVPESIEEEVEINATDEAIRAEEERIAAEEKRIAEERAAMRWHTVKNGETVSAIAAKEKTSLARIKELNPGMNINKIRIGQKIRIN